MLLLAWAGQAFLLYLAATFVFDLVHWTMHALSRSRFPPLRALGGLHQTHHEFLDAKLGFDDALIQRNLWRHRAPELATQLLGASLGLLLFPWAPVLATATLFAGSFLVGVLLDGKDSNHRSQRTVPAALGGIFVGLAYHSLHHVYPERYFGSVTTLFDRLFGTGCQLAGRRVLLTGASGCFGGPLKGLLEAEGSIVTPLEHGAFGSADLGLADILVLAHGSKGADAMAANCDASLLLIERFRRATRGRLVSPEVWAVGSEIECHPAFGNVAYYESKRAFARHARRLFHEREVLYRHIVPSAFTSPMGRGLMSGRFAAWWALFFIKRGCRYVPVSYTGLALLNYLKFALRIHATKAPSSPQEENQCS